MRKVSVRRRSSHEKKDGTAALYAVFTIKRRKVRIPIGLSVTEAEWDPVKEGVRGHSAKARDKNLIISNVLAKITEILVRFRLTEEPLTPEAFLIHYSKPGETMNFNDFAMEHLREMSGAIAYGTYVHHENVLRKVREYAPGLQLGEITPEWLNTYAVYLRDKLNNNPGTIRKNLSMIRVHYMAAIRAGKVRANPFENFRMPASDPAVVYLTEEELGRLIALYRSGRLVDTEQTALRFFLFMCFTAMHISDARNLQIEQVYGGEIHYTRRKTRVKVDLPMSEPAKKLYEFYRGGRMRGTLITGLPSDQNFNRLIKIVCSRANITKPISAKAARHTFATIYYKRNHGDVGTLAKLLGHVKINTTMIYAHITKDSRVAGVAAFDDLM